MMKRKEFLKKISAAGMVAGLPKVWVSEEQLPAGHAPSRRSDPLIWAGLLHVSYNMWTDHVYVAWDDLPADYYADDDFEIKSCADARRWARGYRPYLTFDYATWKVLLEHMVDAGMTMVVIDLGDAVKYDSHPEIAVENAWSTSKLRNEVTRIRNMGLEPIPKLNFASTHSAWMGEYSRMISTRKYYTVCKNLIREVITLFERPRFFHLGMDEETAHHQRRHKYVTIRQFDLWWHDFYYLVDQVESNNARPWIWSDYGWHEPERFFKKMPKSVLQSNWHYGDNFDFDTLPERRIQRIKMYDELERHGYDQVPTGSNHSNPDNFGLTVDYCKKVIDPSRLKGFMQTAWRPTLPACTSRHKEAIDQVGKAIRTSRF